MTHERTTRLLVLGSTGSIGTQTLDVVAHLNTLAADDNLPPRFEIVGLASGSNAALVLEQAAQFGVRNIAIASEDAATNVNPPSSITVRTGQSAAEQLIQEVECDLVMASIVGSAGLGATLAAAQLGRDIALANKEALVAAGELVTKACAQTGAKLLPVDSEHAAIWQALQPHGEGAHASPLYPPIALSDGAPKSVKRVILTASGGAFRDRPLSEIATAPPAEALAHPTWDMGAKVTIDSASLTNKALEVIEAHWLFGLAPEQLSVLVHRQSTVHSLVEYIDGNILAQLGTNDMRIPIGHALTFPKRLPTNTEPLDLAKLATLDFATPCPNRYPALACAWRVMELGGTSGAVFNAANEAAVEAYLKGRCTFGDLAKLSSGALEHLGTSPVRTIDDVLEAEHEARAWVATQLAPASSV